MMRKRLHRASCSSVRPGAERRRCCCGRVCDFRRDDPSRRALFVARRRDVDRARVWLTRRELEAIDRSVLERVGMRYVETDEDVRALACFRHCAPASERPGMYAVDDLGGIVGGGWKRWGSSAARDRVRAHAGGVARVRARRGDGDAAGGGGEREDGRYGRGTDAVRVREMVRGSVAGARGWRWRVRSRLVERSGVGAVLHSDARRLASTDDKCTMTGSMRFLEKRVK